MLTLRREQLLLLAAPQRERFIQYAVGYVAKHFPDQHAALGAESSRRAVADAIERAESYGFERDADVLAYVTLVFMFGRDFDRDPEHAWAGEVLRSPEGPDARMSRLQALALAHEESGRGYHADGGQDRA
jgi:hypothetical protein